MAGSSEPAFLFLGTKRELVLHRLFIYFATAPYYFLIVMMFSSSVPLYKRLS